MVESIIRWESRNNLNSCLVRVSFGSFSFFSSVGLEMGVFSVSFNCLLCNIETNYSLYRVSSGGYAEAPSELYRKDETNQDSGGGFRGIKEKDEGVERKENK